MSCHTLSTFLLELCKAGSKDKCSLNSMLPKFKEDLWASYEEVILKMHETKLL